MINELEELFKRLAKAKSKTIIVTQTEIQNWPKHLFEVLFFNQLLTKSNLAKSTECPGCEEYCHMPVISRHNEAINKTVAFIVCDQRDDIGRVKLDIDSLKQWKITDKLVAKFISKQLNLKLKPAREENLWDLGSISHRNKIASINLHFKDTVYLSVSGHEIALSHLMDIVDKNIYLDIKALNKLILRKPKTNKTKEYSPLKVRQENRKLNTQAMYQEWNKAYLQWKNKKPDASDVWISIQISKSKTGQGRTPATIRKNMK